MKKTIIWIVLLSFVLAACAPAATPEPTATPDIMGTTEALAKEMVSGTLTAMPTNTPLPTATSLPTETPLPSETPLPAETATPTPAPTLPPFYGEFAPAGLPQGVDKGYILFENETNIRPVSLNISGTTAQGARPYYYVWTFHESQHRWDLPFGTYNYVIFLGDKKTFYGSFRINNTDKTTIFIKDNKVVIAGP
ncbi:MAG: hypothetical protein CVU44_17630 [Chloroflexi bacterium HGW-Chloroflexi-6]|nr:MAG: hypothetical protein CVU44_17630 [Chloroflexi bacterium HGW-Chloroflexi-6]